MTALTLAKKILVFWVVWNRIRNCLIALEINSFLIPRAAAKTAAKTLQRK